MAQQRLGVLPAAGDADADADEDLVLAELEAALQDRDDPLGQRRRIRLAYKQHRELVPAHPRTHIPVPNAAPQPLSDRHQKLITDGVPDRVIDQLKAVEIHEQHGHWLTPPVGSHKFVLHTIQQQPTIRQACQ